MRVRQNICNRFVLLGDIALTIVSVLGSFALFGLGTWAALTKHRWHRLVAPPQDGA